MSYIEKLRQLLPSHLKFTHLAQINSQCFSLFFVLNGR